MTVSGRSFGPNFGFPYTLFTFSPPSAQNREVSLLRETFSPKLPSRMTPELWFLCSARCLMLIDIYMKFREDGLKGFQVIERTRFCDRVKGK